MTVIEERKEQQKQILVEIRDAYVQCTRMQIKTLHDEFKDLLTKIQLNQIIRGVYVSENNMKYARLLLSKMQSFSNQNAEKLNNLSNHVAQEDK